MSEDIDIHDQVTNLLNDAPTPTSDDDFDALLDRFIARQMEEAQDNIIEQEELQKQNKPIIASQNNKEHGVNLAQEENQLFTAYRNFINAVASCASVAEIEIPEFLFEANDIYPRFRPNRIKNLNNDIFYGWKTLTLAQPIRLESLPLNPSDEQILNFAEKTTDENLQSALISYVEILIELDNCEIAYNIRRAKAKKRLIERKIIEEHNQRKTKIESYIKAIRKEKFPIDAERLVNNFFKTARKDPDGAQKILESNPATYAPIEIEKIPSRLFGLVKAKPEDGIRFNKKIGNFFKKLRKQ